MMDALAGGPQIHLLSPSWPPAYNLDNQAGSDREEYVASMPTGSADQRLRVRAGRQQQKSLASQPGERAFVNRRDLAGFGSAR
jgi:hypothetical protein